MNLSPAKWIWLPSERCLHNTFVLFRKTLNLAKRPTRAVGWITADSRYKLTVNGRRVQWGPAPCDPRFQDVDPVDLAGFLQAGENVIGVEVCYFGDGDGTWPMGSPGLLFNLEIESSRGQIEHIVSDASWKCLLDRAHRPGQFKRWFLRALQEQFDARLHPYGWDAPRFEVDETRWLRARELPGAPDMPAIFAGGPAYVLTSDNAQQHAAADIMPKHDRVGLRARDIPLIHESSIVEAKAGDASVQQARVKWLRDPDDWFESRIPDSFEIQRDRFTRCNDGVWTLPMVGDLREGLTLTFELPEQVIGWPRFTIDTPADTIVELIVRESHDPATGPLWLENYIYHWTRFICREGVNELETFDYESVKWIQLHVRNPTGKVRISNVGVRRRIFPWPNAAQIRIDEAPLQKLFDATVNTLNNCASDSIQDGAGRERQQYSGDCGHQLQAIRYVFGETRQPKRFLKTFSQGLTLEGYFLDCWPAYDRLARIMQRQMGTTVWGPLLDHGIGFNFDCWSHYWETGDKDSLVEPYPRLVKFAQYLLNLRRDDGMLPVEDIGVPAVWMDHYAYKRQRHKRCAFNLYAAAMLEHALGPICKVMGDAKDAATLHAAARELIASTVKAFWDAERRTFVNNLPWMREEGEVRTCDRSLATAILFVQCPDHDIAAAARSLAECPADMGFSYPANAGWRLRALAKVGRADVVVRELRTRWSALDSVARNNTLQEVWDATPNSNAQYSHCAVAPIFILMTDLLGIRPTSPGFAIYEIEPKLADLGALNVTAHTAAGPIAIFTAPRGDRGHTLSITTPAGGDGELVIGDQRILLRKSDTTTHEIP